MTIAWLLYVLLVGTLLCAGATALSAAAVALRRPSRGVWAAALGGIVALGVIAPERTLIPVALESSESLAVAPNPRTITHARADDGVRAAWAVIGQASTSLIGSLDRRVPRAVATSMVVVWATASALLLALFVLVNARAAMLRRRWPVQLLHGVAARVAPTSGPAVLGLVRPEIVVPRSLLERSDDEQRLILAHEREHVRALDHLLLAAAWLVVVALPWHPAVWYILGRLRLAIEIDCDARVLRAGASPRRYGTLLIEVAARNRANRIGALALADGPSQLERRIRAMDRSRRRNAAATAAAACAFSALLVLAACEAKIPTVAEIEQMDVASAQRAAAQGGLLRTPSSDRIDVFINGVRVSTEEARALEARKIGSLTLVKSERSTGRDTMFVVTTDKLSAADRQAVSGKQPDPLEQSERSFARKVAPDTEHIVEHVFNERERMRVARAPSVPETREMQPMRKSTSAGRDEAPIITIDGKIATEAQLAALDERDIASMAVYKGKEALMQLVANKNQQLEVTSGLAARIGAKESEALIAVKTKMAQQAQAKRP